MRSCLACLTALVVVSSVAKAAPLIASYSLVAPPQRFVYAQPTQAVLPHPTVVGAEAALPATLSKSHLFYGNPYVASALASESLNFNKEALTYDRPSDQIDRREIYKLIGNLKRAHHE